MNQKQFILWNRITGFVVLAIASLTYLLTIEPTVSFWDCGEFIASSYKLEVGHAPGNPVFQLIGRFFSMFVAAENVAAAINVMSALCSAFTIFFLYLTIVHLGRCIAGRDNEPSLSTAILIYGAGVVGSLAYCWSDTFWFSAVEGEVYAMSSLFTAVVFWAILKWEEEADTEYANRWIVLISLLMGLSIGVHLLNLLVIPGIAFIIYYKKAKKFSFWKGFGVLCLSGVVLGFVLWGIIPVLPKIACYFDLFFVNVLGAPFNVGAALFVILLMALCFVGIWLARKYEKPILDLVLLCYTMIVIGYSVFAVVVIRSVVNTPTNEGGPDNPFALVKYLGREQYGSVPIIYGETFATKPVAYNTPKYWTKMGDKYEYVNGPLEYEGPSEGKMLFPRMHSRQSGHIALYQQYMHNGRGGRKVPGTDYKIPTMAENLAFFFDYQLGYMYLRYFMWNFAGRQNDLHGQTPADVVQGNWECGIDFIDRMRLGDQSVGPDIFVHNKAKNHYYMLPLLLGLIGLFFQLNRDRQNWWVVMLLFLLTGVAIIVYLNQSPYQVRERDYAYAGSFYMFCIWIGLAVMAVGKWLNVLFKGKFRLASSLVTSLLLLCVPLQMVSQSWDDHDRSNRYTCRDLAYNYLNSADANAIIVTHGDNDTFPLWYSQEVEGERHDVRIMNTSLLGIDWYIDQMQCKQYEAEPIRFTTKREQYLYGTNDFPHVYDVTNGKGVLLSAAFRIFNDPRYRRDFYGTGEKEDYICANKLLLPVNKENALKAGIITEKDMHKVVDTVVFDLGSKRNIDKTELMILDYLSTYQWDRPIYFVTQGGDLDFGLQSWLQFDGFIYKLVPIKSKTTQTSIGQIVPEQMYDKVMNVYKWDSFGKDYYSDYTNISTLNGIMNLRFIFTQTAVGLYESGDKERAVEVLDKMQEKISTKNLPLNTAFLYSVNEYMVLQAIEIYSKSGAIGKAMDLGRAFMDETYLALVFYANLYKDGLCDGQEIQTNAQFYYYTVDLVKEFAPEVADEYEERLKDIIE